MKKTKNPHDLFNHDIYPVRRTKYLIAQKMLSKGENPIPLRRDGSLYLQNGLVLQPTKRDLLKWFFKFGFDVGMNFKGRIFHLKPKEKENEACGYSIIGFRFYEVKNESV